MFLRRGLLSIRAEKKKYWNVEKTNVETIEKSKPLISVLMLLRVLIPGTINSLDQYKRRIYKEYIKLYHNDLIITKWQSCKYVFGMTKIGDFSPKSKYLSVYYFLANKSSKTNKFSWYAYYLIFSVFLICNPYENYYIYFSMFVWNIIGDINCFLENAIFFSVAFDNL